jgi:hypothetical protein
LQHNVVEPGQHALQGPTLAFYGHRSDRRGEFDWGLKIGAKALLESGEYLREEIFSEQLTLLARHGHDIERTLLGGVFDLGAEGRLVQQQLVARVAGLELVVRIEQSKRDGHESDEQFERARTQHGGLVHEVVECEVEQCPRVCRDLCREGLVQRSHAARLQRGAALFVNEVFTEIDAHIIRNAVVRRADLDGQELIVHRVDEVDRFFHGLAVAFVDEQREGLFEVYRHHPAQYTRTVHNFLMWQC